MGGVGSHSRLGNALVVLFVFGMRDGTRRRILSRYASVLVKNAKISEKSSAGSRQNKMRALRRKEHFHTKRELFITMSMYSPDYFLLVSDIFRSLVTVQSVKENERCQQRRRRNKAKGHRRLVH